MKKMNREVAIFLQRFFIKSNFFEIIQITFRLRLPNMMQNRSQLIQKCDDLKLTLKWKQKYKLFGSSNEISPDDWIEVENVGTWGCDENEVVLNVIKGAQELIK